MSTQNTSHGRKRMYLAAGSLVGVAALVTAAAFTDFANLNLTSGSDDSGIGGNNRFNIQVVGTDDEGTPVPGSWQEAATTEGVDITLPGSDLIAPGDTLSVSIPFRNESPVLGADLTFTLQDRPGSTSDTGIAEALRYTLSVDGTALVTDVPQAAVAGIALGQLLAGEGSVLDLSVTLPDQGSDAANNTLQGQVFYVQAHLDAASTQQ
ncbi:hypothetical protein [Sanguibacter inulinus]|uniref:Alternate-type signal peptide domain-containing protein n=1 Tax=Sanguibacter inulinus TaxID=60922 RepID=A0A853EMZ7_9MICO|nr:hypothetical protein [Sanguibacter inulinus]MBF0720844.1 hypothetical protein [Sanguibacter inulinus]NYS91989.1 hypothetical protein [Sanguibacter inulinus]